jgi:hypothetical protein
MLDVHPPDHKLQGVRDFLMHLLTITAGLLIALALENAAEAIHHRHQRKEAETLIRQELASNRDAVQESNASLQKEMATMAALLNALEARSEGKPATLPKPEDIEFSEGSIPNAAWSTASTTGALSYMEYSEVERFSEAYKEQEQLQRTEEVAANDYMQLMPILHSHMTDVSPELAKEALPYARSAIGHLSGVYSIEDGTMRSYNDALK